MEIGRPKAHIDWHTVGDYLTAGCSGREIAGLLGLNPCTIYERCLTDHGISFSEFSQQFYAKGESLLRKTQFDKALGINKDGDNSMLIWLGKNRLGQKEPETSIKYTEEQLDNQKALIQGLEEFRKNKESQVNNEQKS